MYEPSPQMMTVIITSNNPANRNKTNFDNVSKLIIKTNVTSQLLNHFPAKSISSLTNK